MNPNQNPHFQAFFGPQGPQQVQEQIPPFIIINQFILEIVNNWDEIKRLLKKQKNGTLKKVQPIDQEWFNFLTNNKIDLSIYEKSDDFQNAYWKIPQN